MKLTLVGFLALAAGIVVLAIIEANRKKNEGKPNENDNSSSGPFFGY